MEYQVIEKEERLQFLEEMFESTELKVTESYSHRREIGRASCRERV